MRDASCSSQPRTDLEPGRTSSLKGTTSTTALSLEGLGPGQIHKSSSIWAHSMEDTGRSIGLPVLGVSGMAPPVTQVCVTWASHFPCLKVSLKSLICRLRGN